MHRYIHMVQTVTTVVALPSSTQQPTKNEAMANSMNSTYDFVNGEMIHDIFFEF